MAKTPKKTGSLVPTSGRRVPRAPAAATPTPIGDRDLRPLVGSDVAASKLVGKGGDVVVEGLVTLVTGRAYAARERIVPAEAVFFDRAAGPGADGPWLGEADKVCWRDDASGYDCIMMRERSGGHLRGFVGISENHPLWGWESEAVPPDLGIEVHGGLDYSQVCQDGPSPSLHAELDRICHVPGRSRVRPLDVTGHSAEGSHAWWFGFSCDQPYDLIPNRRSQVVGFMQAEIGRQYRDDAYVVREILALAAQLRAVADGVEAPPRTGTPPPIGLDPRRGGRS